MNLLVMVSLAPSWSHISFAFIAIRYGILPHPVHQDEYCRACPLTVPEHDLKIQKAALLS